MRRRLSILIITLITIIFISLFIVRLIFNKINPLISDYSVAQMKRIISSIINRSINSNVFNKEDLSNLYIINYDKDTTTVILDSVIVNRITDIISDACEDNLRLVENGKYNLLKEKFNIGEEYFYVPSSIFFNSTLLSLISPKIPISLKMIGNVTSGINTDVKEYGINNSLITISTEITVEMMVILPFTSDYVSITNYVPISVRLIQGKVPEFYNKIKGTNP